MDQNEIIPPGFLENDTNQEPTENYRDIYYRMEVSRRVEEFRRAIHTGKLPIISEISQLIIFKTYFNELTGANLTSLDLLQQANKLSEFRLPQTTPLSPARRAAEMLTQAAILEEHQSKHDKTVELIHLLELKIDELITAKTSPDLLPACKLVLTQYNEAFKSQLDSCLVFTAEIRAHKNLVCTDLEAADETMVEFQKRYALAKAEHGLKDPPKVRTLTMSTNLKRTMGYLATNAKGSKTDYYLKLPSFNNNSSIYNFLSRNYSPADARTSTPRTPRSTQPLEPTTTKSTTTTARQSERQAPRSTSTAQLSSTPTATTTTSSTEQQPDRTSTPRPSGQTIPTPITAPEQDKFIFTHNIFLSEKLLNAPNLEVIKHYFSNIKNCFGDSTDFAGQSRTRVADLSYLQRSIILASRFHPSSSDSLDDTPLLTVKKVNYLPKPSSIHALLMSLNFIELLKSKQLKQPITLATPSPLPPGYIAINSDKTSNCCIIEKNTYISLMQRFLDTNSEIFEEVRSSSAFYDIQKVDMVLNHIKKLALDWGLLPAELEAVTSKNVTLPKLRGLAKTHKSHTFHWNSLKFRPIIGSSSSVLSNLAILLDKLLQPIATQVSFRIRDSFHALDFFKSIDLEKYYVVSFDAVSLYTNISKDLAMNAITFWFEDLSNMNLIPSRFRNLLFVFEALELLFSHNYFTFNGQIYLQQDGLSMGCNAAVSIAELSLGYLESINDFDPTTHKRYIDDAVDIVLKTEAETVIPQLLNKYNNLDDNINWTCEFDFKNPITVFLDMVIDYSIPGIYQFHKPTKKIDSFVPYDSNHPKHTLSNLPRSLFDRAFTLNIVEKRRNLAFKQIEQGLTILKYPHKIIADCKSKARRIVPKKYTPETGNGDHTIIYLCLTNNNTNTINPLYADITILNRILHMDDSGALNNIHIKISKRQPPSVGTLNNMLSGAHADQNPVRCGRKICDTCPVISLSKTVILIDPNEVLHTIKAARFTCKSRNLIYFIFDPITKVPLYIGHTGQQLLSRMYQHRGGKKKNSGKSKIRFGFLKNNSPNKIHFQITAITASPLRVKRLETERFYINIFKPTWNCQLQHFWWQDASFEYTDKE